MQSEPIENKTTISITTRKTIRWGVTAIFVIILGTVFYFIHRYFYNIAGSGLANVYLTFVLALLIIWFIGIILFLIYLVLKYDPLMNIDSPYANQTLGLPPGTFRAILTMSLLFAVVLLEGYALTNMEQHEKIQQVLDPLLTAFQLMIAFYFGTKMIGIISGKGEEEIKPKG
jgi:hypothetical protein